MFTFSAKKVQKIKKVVPSCSFHINFGQKTLLTCKNKMQKK